MIAKAVATHVVGWHSWLHFHFTFSRLVLSQLQSNPVRKVVTILDQLLSDGVRDIIKADGAVWHHSSLHSLGSHAVIRIRWPQQRLVWHFAEVRSTLSQCKQMRSFFISLPPMCMCRESLQPCTMRAMTCRNRDNRCKVASILPIVF